MECCWRLRYAESLFDLAKEENKVTQYLDRYQIS